HEQIGDADSREDVVGPLPFIPVVQFQIQKGKDVRMPDVEIDADCPLSPPELLDAHGGVVELPRPGDDAGGSALETFDVAAAAPHLSQVDADAPAVFGKPGHVGVAVVDVDEGVRYRADEAAGQLAVGKPGGGQGGRGHRQVKVGQGSVGFLNQEVSPLLRLVLHQVQSDRQPALRGEFINVLFVVGRQI